MKNKLIILLSAIIFSFLSLFANAQIQIDWPICVQEKMYWYTNAKLDDFVIKYKRIKFCYNYSYFGFDKGDGYIQVFPLERLNSGVDRFGNITEEFINGECQNYARGDMQVTITHSKPQSILIQNTREITSYAYYIKTNSLYTGKVKLIKDLKKEKSNTNTGVFSIDSIFRAHYNPSLKIKNTYPNYNIDSFVNKSAVWGNGSDTGIIVREEIDITIKNDGSVSYGRDDGRNGRSTAMLKTNKSIINDKYKNSLVLEKKLIEIFSQMPKWETKMDYLKQREYGTVILTIWAK